MSINIGPAPSDELRPKIMVIGVGGAGGNAIANMMDAQIEGVDFIVANTDAQALSTSMAEARIQLGPDITGGLGAGARPEVGKAAAEETVGDIEAALDGVNMVFIAAGMGGGTGTGAAPVIAEAARRKGVLTVGVVTKPFQFEGTRRMRAADSGIDELQKHVDTLIVIPNQNLFLVAKAETTFKEAFQLADEVLQQGVRSITDLMVMPGLINLDFADVRSVMQEMGKAMMGTGEAEGEGRALEAAQKAIANPLLDGVSMAGAKGVIISIIGGEDMKLLEVDEAANHIRDLVDEDANIIWGSAFNPDLEGKIRVSVVATGIDNDGSPIEVATRSFSLAESRPPKRPVFALSDNDQDEVEGEEPMELSSSFEEAHNDDMRTEPARTASLEVAARQDDHGEGDEADDDVDDIVDPLAGLRNEETERFEDGFADEGLPSPTEGPNLNLEAGYADPASHSGKASSGSAARSGYEADPLDLSADDMTGGDAVDDGYVQTSPLRSKPTGRRRTIGGGGGAGGAGDGEARSVGAAGGSTLFERMANLSRSASSEEEDDDEDDGGNSGTSLNIPRFLGRQNNQ